MNQLNLLYQGFRELWPDLTVELFEKIARAAIAQSGRRGPLGPVEASIIIHEELVRKLGYPPGNPEQKTL